MEGRRGVLEGKSSLMDYRNQGASNCTGELWSKFPFLAEKVAEKSADSKRDCGKYDIFIISRISNLH